jgi:hypothetical protein
VDQLASSQSYLDEGIHLLELAQSARRLFERQEPREKRQLLNIVVSNCSWKGGELAVTLRQPFDIPPNTASIGAVETRAEGEKNRNSETWLGDLEATPE